MSDVWVYAGACDECGRESVLDPVQDGKRVLFLCWDCAEARKAEAESKESA